MRILVLGYLVRGPLGGMAWHHLQYALGFAELGYDVYFLEESGEGESCYDPRTNDMTADPSYGLAFAEAAFTRLGLGGRWAFYDSHRDAWLGPAGGRAIELCSSADVVLNLSASNLLRDAYLGIPHRVLVDTDPVFTQVRHLTQPAAHAKAERHTAFFSFGENIGRGASVPDDGFHWQPTRQPIVLGAWPVAPGRPESRYTTVMQWESYAALEYAGNRYGMKSQSFGPYLDLPRRTSSALELAVGAPAAAKLELEANGWHVANPLEAASDPWRYQHYLAGSKAEFTVAKHGYVVSGSGWFSERSAGYLASGRPVVTEDTGFGAWLPAGEGVLAFDSPERALEALDDVERRYALHCRAARAIAEEHFDSRKVLASLLDRAVREA